MVPSCWGCESCGFKARPSSLGENGQASPCIGNDSSQGLELEDSLLPSNPQALQDSFLQWSWTKKVSQLLQESEVLHDAGGLEAAKLEEKLSQARLKLSQATKNMHWADSEISWRADLAKDAGLEDILAQAQADRSLCSLDGAAIENAISNYQQVGRVLQDSDLIRIRIICHMRLFAICHRW